MKFKEWLKIRESEAIRLAMMRKQRPEKGRYRPGEYMNKPPPVAIGTMEKK